MFCLFWSASVEHDPPLYTAVPNSNSDVALARSQSLWSSRLMCWESVPVLTLFGQGQSFHRKFRGYSVKQLDAYLLIMIIVLNWLNTPWLLFWIGHHYCSELIINHLDARYVALTWLFVSLSRVIGMEPNMLALVKDGSWNRSFPHAWIARWLDRVWIRSIWNLLKRMSSGIFLNTFSTIFLTSSWSSGVLHLSSAAQTPCIATVLQATTLGDLLTIQP